MSTTPQSSPPATLESLQAEIAALRAQLDDLLAHRSEPPPAAGREVPRATSALPEEHQAAEHVRDRRAVLRGGAVAAGLVAGLAANAAFAGPAAAADGDPVILGDDEQEAASTTWINPVSNDPTVQSLPMFASYIGTGFDGFAYGRAVLLGSADYVDNGDDTVPQGLFGVLGTGNTPGGAGGYFNDFGSTGGSSAIALSSSYAQLFLAQDEASPSAIPAPASPLDSTAPRRKGEVVFDVNGDLWLCVASGTPGTWRKLAGPESGAPTLLPTPVRIYDSRPGYTPLAVTKARLQSNEERGISALVGQQVPPQARAVICNITVANTSERGWLAAYAGGASYPGTSTINWTQAGSVTANAATVRLGTSGFMTLKCSQDSSTDVVVDVTGYYV